ncbi:MAG: flagellar protein FlaG [Nitrospinaceae bacterium]
MSAEISLQSVVLGFSEKRPAFSSRLNQGQSHKPLISAADATEELPKQMTSTGSGESKNQAPSLNRKLEYEINFESHEVVVKVIDGNTGEVIRQIPQEDFLRLTQKVSEFNRRVFEEFA